MRTMVIGAGAAGIYYGAKLAVAGQPVVFVARDENLIALRERGVRIDRAEGTLVVDPVEAVPEPAQAGPCDVVLVTVKSIATQGVAYLLRPVVQPDAIVLSLQSGTENDEILSATLGLPPLMRAITDLAAELVEPARVRYHARGRVVFGEPHGRRSERAERLVGLFVTAGIGSELCDDIARRRWSRLAWEAAFNAVTALHRCTIGEAVAHPQRRRMLRDAMQEVIAVATASGVPLDPAAIEAQITHSGTELGDLKTPMLLDIERGWRIEIHALNGAVLRAADQVGVSTPVNNFLYEVLRRYDDYARRHLPHVGVTT